MPNTPRHFYEFGQFRLDADTHRLLRDGEAVPLSPKAIEALLALVRNPGKLLEREALMQAVWADTFVEDANLTVAISHLRKALGQNGETGEYIETVPRIGYRFVVDVREIVEELAPLIVEKRTLSRTVIEEELIPDQPLAQPGTATIVVQPSQAKRPSFSASRNAIAASLAVAAVSVIALGSFIYFKNSKAKRSTVSSAPLVSIKSIAVMPPKPLSGEPENAPLSLGMADALITRLGATGKILVTPTSTIVRYVDTNQDVLAAGRALRVDAVLDGSLQRDNGRVRVTLRLLGAANGAQLWAGNFDEADADIFKLQDSISQQVAQALSLNLSESERVLLVKQQTSNPEAYALYLKGNYYWSKRGEEAAKGGEYLRRAIELDPNFAQPYVLLAILEATGHAPSPEADMLIDKALKLDSSSAEAQATYGFIRMFQHWDWDGAGKAFDRALELNPNSSVAHHWKGVYLSLLGRLDEAKQEMHRALDLDSLSEIITADIGQLHYFGHEYDAAIEYSNHALALDKDFEYGHRYLVDGYLMKGMYREAIHEWAMLEEGGMRARALEARTTLDLSDFQQEVRSTLPGYVSSHEGRNYDSYIARRYAYAGDKEQTLRWLERASEVVGVPLPFVNVDPLYDFVRDEPRFKEVIRRIGLPARS
jgi:DNA-binding winged helix-turn-helix (wHTH) protein/TolB-like protein/Tfp pilus assembly protein PilF